MSAAARPGHVKTDAASATAKSSLLFDMLPPESIERGGAKKDSSSWRAIDSKIVT